MLVWLGFQWTKNCHIPPWNTPDRYGFVLSRVFGDKTNSSDYAGKQKWVYSIVWETLPCLKKKKKTVIKAQS